MLGKLILKGFLLLLAFLLPRWLICSYRPLSPSFLCFIGALRGMMFRLCLIIMRSTQSYLTAARKMCWRLALRAQLIWLWFLPIDRHQSVLLAPGDLGVWCDFSLGDPLCFLVVQTNYGYVRIGWQIYRHVVLVTIVAEPVHVLNLTILWMVGGMSCSWNSAGRPSKMFCSAR